MGKCCENSPGFIVTKMEGRLRSIAPRPRQTFSLGESRVIQGNAESLIRLGCQKARRWEGYGQDDVMLGTLWAG